MCGEETRPDRWALAAELNRVAGRAPFGEPPLVSLGIDEQRHRVAREPHAALERGHGARIAVADGDVHVGVPF